MQPVTPVRTDILLLGAGHAHVEVLRRFAMRPEPGVRLILGEATGIDLERQEVAIPGRPAVPFDLLSIDVGGAPAMPPDAGIPVKPIGGLLDRLAALEAGLPEGARIAVVGGGP